jgi:hypothetical protein
VKFSGDLSHPAVRWNLEVRTMLPLWIIILIVVVVVLFGIYLIRRM